VRSSLGDQEARNKEKALNKSARRGFQHKVVVFISILVLIPMIPAFWNILLLR
jgi:hypothetical protein